MLRNDKLTKCISLRRRAELAAQTLGVIMLALRRVFKGPNENVVGLHYPVVGSGHLSPFAAAL